MLMKEKTVWIVGTFALSAAAIVMAVSTVAKADVPATIKNLDQKTYRLMVEEGDNKREIIVAPSQEVPDLCGSTCLLTVGDDPDAYEVVANDRVTIEEGLLIYQSDDTETQTSDENDTSADPEPAPEGDGEAQPE